MLEGSNDLTYWAISDYGDSSRMGNRTVLQDTQAPQINASLNGTAGENGWFVSPAELTVAYSDPVPGSGLSVTSALINGTPTDVSQPVTLPEGVYSVMLDVRDVAGLTAQVTQTVYVDTTAPALSPQQPQAEVNGYMNGSVIFQGAVSDATSGVRTVQVTVDGVNWDTATLNVDGTWVLDWNSAGMGDGAYTPQVAAVNNAGNRTETSLSAIHLDNTPPGMSMTNAWYIWESGHLRVEDSRAGIQRIELSVRDDQGRWPAVVWEYDTPVLERDLQWNRRFADDTIAPIGSYEVLLQAWDKLGNESWLTARIHVPAAGATPPIPPQTILTAGGKTPTVVPTLQVTQPAAAVETSPANTLTANPTKIINISSEPEIPDGIAKNKQGDETKNAATVDSNLLWGAAAVSAAAGAAAYALQKKKEREAARKAAEEAARDAAYAQVAAHEERKRQNYLQKVYAERKRAAEALYTKRMSKVEDIELGPEEAPVICGLEQAKDVEVYGPSQAEQQRIAKLTQVEEITADKNVIDRITSNDSTANKGFFGKIRDWVDSKIIKPVTNTVKKIATVVREKIVEPATSIVKKVIKTVNNIVERGKLLIKSTVSNLNLDNAVTNIRSTLNSSTVKAGVGIGATMIAGALALKSCPGTVPAVTEPALNETALFETAIVPISTEVHLTMIAEYTQTAMAITPSPMPSLTPTLMPTTYSYVVQPGETLSVLANRFGVSVEEIKIANNLVNNNIQVGQQIVIPVKIPVTASGIIRDVLYYERPTEEHHQTAWGAINIFGDPNSDLYPNSWWLEDGEITVDEVLSIIMQGEAADNLSGQKAIAARYIYFCGTTSDCNGDTGKFLDFLTYFHAWRESGLQAENISELPSQEILNSATALTIGDEDYLSSIGFSGALEVGAEDIPFHFANVSDNWNLRLHNILNRNPDNPKTNFWVLSIEEVKQICPGWGLNSPDMTDDTTISQCN